MRPGASLRWRAAAGAVALLGALAAPVVARQEAPLAEPDDEAIERQVDELSTELRCPVCTGTSLAESPTELSTQMRAVMRDQLRAGRTPDEVKEYFVSKYGEWILLEPRASGFNLLVYVLPWIAVLAGIGVVVLVVRRWLPSGGEAPEPARPEASDASGPTPWSGSAV